MEIEKKKTLLSIIAKIGSGIEEQESNDIKNFLFIPNHRRIFDPNILVVTGGRGTGKTALFRFLGKTEGRKIVKNLLGSKEESLERSFWITGYGNQNRGEKTFPAQEVIEDRVNQGEWRYFWTGLLLSSIIRNFEEEFTKNIPEDVKVVLKNNLSEISKWLPVIKDNLESLNVFLDRMDTELTNTNMWIFVTYDELDRIVSKYSSLAEPIRELLSFWLDKWRRWERIRPKIFLRTDLFRKEFLSFPDASKLQAHQVKLEWESKYLYQLIIKRLANSDKEMAEYINLVPGLVGKKDDDLGYIPKLEETLFVQFMNNIVGEYMGANPRKGASYRWITNHLQDAEGRITPRSFIKIFSAAATLGEERNANLEELRLIHPSDFQGALMSTSEDRIAELKEEYPWIELLKNPLEGREVPMEKEQFLLCLEKVWKSNPTLLKMLPSENSMALLEHLSQLGIIEVRSDKRINMPEIYLYGFMMKRRGGIKRPK